MDIENFWLSVYTAQRVTRIDLTVRLNDKQSTKIDYKVMENRKKKIHQKTLKEVRIFPYLCWTQTLLDAEMLFFLLLLNVDSSVSVIVPTESVLNQ